MRAKLRGLIAVWDRRLRVIRGCVESLIDRCVNRPERLIFGLFLLIILGRPLFLGYRFFDRDLLIFWEPMKAFFAETLKSGHLPLWNPHLLGGVPFFADPTTACLDPLGILFIILPFQSALSIWYGAYFVVAGAGSYLLWSRRGHSRWAAIWGAVLYGAGGYTLSMLPGLTFFASICLYPLLYERLDGLLNCGRPRAIFLCALVLAWAYCLGDPIGLGAALFVYGLERWVIRENRERLSTKSVLLMLLIAAGLTAPQWSATAELFHESQRWEGLAANELIRWSSPPGRLLELFFPLIFGNDLHPGTFWPRSWIMSDQSGFWARSIYLGVTPVLVLLSGWWLDRRRTIRALIISAPFFLLAWGGYTPLFRWLISGAGLLRIVRYPEKLIFFALLIWILTAIPMFDKLVAWLQREVDSRKRLIQGWSCLAGLTSLIVVLTNADRIDRWTVLRSIGYGGCAVGVWWWLFNPRHTRLPGAVRLTGHLMVDLLLVGWQLIGLASNEPSDENSRYLAFQGEGRFALFTSAKKIPRMAIDESARGIVPRRSGLLIDNVGMLDGIDTLTGFVPLKLSRTERLMSMERVHFDRLLDLFSVDRLILGAEPVDESRYPIISTLGPYTVRANRSAAPRGYWSTRFRPVYQSNQVLGLLAAPDVSPLVSPVVEVTAGSFNDADWPLREFVAWATCGYQRPSPTQIDLMCDVSVPGLVVVSEAMAYGWRAAVDGHDRPVLHVNLALGGVLTTAGAHRISFTFWPRSWVLGICLQIATIVGLVGWWWSWQKGPGSPVAAGDSTSLPAAVF